ncbi:MAG: hypothetical protein AAFN68_04305, partial [Pseudomonadota bacterium]
MTGAVTSELDQQQLTAHDDQPAAVDLSKTPQSTNITTRLPFGFAKRFGVLVEGGGEHLTLVHKEGIRGEVIMEAQRFL